MNVLPQARLLLDGAIFKLNRVWKFQSHWRFPLFNKLEVALKGLVISLYILCSKFQWLPPGELWYLIYDNVDQMVKHANHRETRHKTHNSGGKEWGRWKTWKQRSSNPFQWQRTFFQGTAVLWIGVDFLHGDKFFTRGHVLPAFLPARSETIGGTGPFRRTCLRHLTFRGSDTPRQKKKRPKWKNRSKLQKKYN